MWHTICVGEVGMKVFVRKASDSWREGQVKEYENLQDCIDTLFETADFGSFEPGVIVEKADDMTKDRCGEECEYEVTIYDTWVE